MKILIYLIGSLGDTLVTVPAIWRIKEHFRDASLHLLTNTGIEENRVPSISVFESSGIVNEFISYSVPRFRPNLFLRLIDILKLLLRLRSRRFDAAVYLAPATDGDLRVSRDAFFFRLAGIKRLIGFRGIRYKAIKGTDGHLPLMPHRTNDLLGRIEVDGITGASVRTDIDIQETDVQVVNEWVKMLEPDGNRAWIAIGPASKMPSKIWPSERYAECVARLIRRHNVWPVVFGGAADAALGQDLVRSWGRGYVAAGALNVRASAAAVQRCQLYLGNDTGTMHLAASCRVPCCAIFSSRDVPGLWYPYGEGHVVFRTDIPCEGCLLVECLERCNECLKAVGVEDVFEAASQLIVRQREKCVV